MVRIPPWSVEVRAVSEPKHDASELVKNALAQEMAAIEYEPLLPVEKKLIAGSLLLGLALLGLLLWLSNWLFPVSGLPG